MIGQPRKGIILQLGKDGEKLSLESLAVTMQEILHFEDMTNTTVLLIIGKSVKVFTLGDKDIIVASKDNIEEIQSWLEELKNG